MSEIKLDGGEISVLKAIGFGGTSISGDQLIQRVPNLGEAELIDILDGLMMMGYVVSDKQSLRTIEEVKSTTFHINSGYSKDLHETVDPRRKAPAKPSKRVRRE